MVGSENGGGLDMHDLQQVLSDKMHLDSEAAASFVAGLHLYMDDDPYKVQPRSLYVYSASNTWTAYYQDSVRSSWSAKPFCRWSSFARRPQDYHPVYNIYHLISSKIAHFSHPSLTIYL